MKMARSKDGDGIKSALIIAEVQKRPILYDATHQSYGVRALKMQNWEEVCAAVLPEWTSMGSAEKHVIGKEIQKRWRSIRDSYTKAYRQGKCALPGALPVGGGRRSQHQRQMSFLYSALQQKISRPSTDKRFPETEPASPQADHPLAVVKQEKERKKQEKEKTKQENLNIQLEKENVKYEKENNKQEKENNKQQRENNKKQKENNTQEPTQNKVETILPSIDTAITEDDKLIELKAILLKPKPVEITDMKNIGANLQELKNANEIRNIIDINPSLEIKIDANTILPEDHFDDDRLFMNSLLPFFKKMDDNTRLTCRIEVLKIIKYALQVQNNQNIMQNNFEAPKRPEEITVKEEVKTRPDTSDSGVEKTPISTASSLRMCRKRKASSPPAQSDQPGMRRRGPGRPRKDDCSITRMKRILLKAKTLEDEWMRTYEISRRHANASPELREWQRAERARKREEARTQERDRLTPDEEEMYRATSVTQIKPPQFLKDDCSITRTERILLEEKAQEDDWMRAYEIKMTHANASSELREWQRAERARERARKREEARTRERDRLTPDEEEMYRATSVTQLKPPQFLKMYNLEPAKKPPVTPAASAPDAAAKKDT